MGFSGTYVNANTREWKWRLKYSMESKLRMESQYRQGNYLYHGSPFKVNALHPRQAHDTEYEAGCQEAVYATDNLDMAICFALGVEGGENAERIMLPEYGMKMLFKNCHPGYGQKGYVYILNRDEFVHAMGSQWVAYKKQTPVDIIEINVDDYIEDYCIIVNTEDFDTRMTELVTENSPDI